VLLLQEFDLHIVDRKGAENLVADNLSRLENISFDPIPVNDSFSRVCRSNLSRSLFCIS
jgi:hypothetical protein